MPNDAGTVTRALVHHALGRADRCGAVKPLETLPARARTVDAHAVARARFRAHTCLAALSRVASCAKAGAVVALPMIGTLLPRNVGNRAHFELAARSRKSVVASALVVWGARPVP